MDLTTLILGLAAPFSALAGVWMTQKHVTRENREERVERRRDAQRRILVELMDAGRTWISQAEIMVIFYTKFNEQHFLDFVDSDTAKAHGEVMSRMHLALAEARLAIADDPLGRHISMLSVLIDQIPDKAYKPSLTASKLPESMHGPAAKEGLKHVYRIQRKLDEIERSAAPVLQAAIVPTVQRASQWRAMGRLRGLGKAFKDVFRTRAKGSGPAREFADGDAHDGQRPAD